MSISKIIKTFGVREEETSRIYTVTYKMDNNDTNYIYLDLTLLTGIDYVNPDHNDIQGYVPASHFIDDVQYHSCVCMLEDESIKECLIDNGYEIVEGKEIENIWSQLIS